MAILTHKEDTFECATAIKGDNYICLLDENGLTVARFDGITDFSEFSLDGAEYTAPTADHDCCIAVIRDDGTIGKGGHKCSDIGKAGGGNDVKTVELDFENWENGSFLEVLDDGTSITHTVLLDNGKPVYIDDIQIFWE